MHNTWSMLKNRFIPKNEAEGFWAVVDSNGNWIDSAEAFQTALWFAYVSVCHKAGKMEEPSITEAEMGAIVKKSGISIIHSSFLKTLVEAGRIQ